MSRTRRWGRLLAGLFLFATGIALMVRADLGVSPWDVLHDGLRLDTPLTFGAAVIVVSLLVVLGSFALGVKPGPGTIANVILVGAFTDGLLSTSAFAGLASANLLIRIVVLLAGVWTIAIATALYVGAGLGAGPRDSLMLAVAGRLGVSPGTSRTMIEGSVLVVGGLMGGQLGVGTAVFLIAIGPAINTSFRLLGMQRPRDVHPK